MDTEAIVSERLTTLSPEQAAQRKTHIGSSDIAALFGCGRKSALTLFLEKSGQIDDDFEGNEWTDAGTILEPAIARLVERRQGWKLRNVYRYIEHPKVKGWGASLDREIIGHERGVAPLELKNVNFFMHKQQWGVVEEGGEEEAPLHIELQLQHQIGACGRAWGAIGALVGGFKVQVIERDRDDRIIQAIGEKIEDFWERVRTDRPPEINGEKDLNVLKRLYPNAVPLSSCDLSHDTNLCQRIRDLRAARAAKSAAEKAEKEALAHILQAVGTHEFALCGVQEDGKLYDLTAKTTQRAGFTVEATSFRSIRLVERKPAKS
jgi:predicted phage-related endonuclease